MQLQFTLLTESQSDKKAIYQDIVAYLAADEQNRVFYLTPNHMKFDMEMAVLDAIGQVTDKHDYTAMMRLSVVSFQRLAWFLDQKLEQAPQNDLSEVARVMLIQESLLNLSDQLTIYKGQVKHIGFVRKLSQLFEELAIGNISADDLLTIVSTSADESMLDQDKVLANQVAKIKELSLIYSTYQDVLASQALTTTSLYDQLLGQIDKLDLSHVRVVIDGFYRFNAGEKTVITALLEKSQALNVVMSLDQPYLKQKPDAFDLFLVTGTTYYHLYHYAKDHDIPIAIDQYGQELKNRHVGMPILDQYLRQSDYGQSDKIIRSEDQVRVGQYLHLAKAETPYVESQAVANHIYRLVASGDYRYKDIQILIRDQKNYRESLLPQLQRNEIPYFWDDSDTMENHPLYRMLMGLYHIYRYQWRYEDIFDFLRSELFIPHFISESTEDDEEQAAYFRQVVDRTENVVLKNGYTGPAWWQKRRHWSYLYVDEEGNKEGSDQDIETERLANLLKNYLSASLSDLFQLWDQEATSKEVLAHFYQFLVDYKVQDRLMIWRDQRIAQGDLGQARHHEQAWQSFVQVLEDYVALFADEKFSPDRFFQILETAFQEASYSIVPPSMDSVTITGIDSQRVKRPKISFVMGLTKGTLPKQYHEDSLLTQEDRQMISKGLNWDQAFEPSVAMKQSNERFIAYKTFLSATEGVYLSYPYNADKAQSQGSPYIEQLQAAFQLKVKKYSSQVDLADLGNWRSQLAAFMTKARTARDQELPLDNYWRQIYDRLLASASIKSEVKGILPALNDHNWVENLSEDLAKRLYGQPLAVSVSQIELYNRDPFSYFLKYGLKLRERPAFELDPIQTGNYSHAFLDQFHKKLHYEELTLADLDDDQMAYVFKQISQEFTDLDQYPEFTVFESSAVHRQGKLRLQETLRKLLLAMRQQGQQAGFKAYASESHFNEDRDNFLMRGKIDRWDAFTWKGQTYYQIIDYKSSQRKLGFREIYSGRQLQLLAYLSVALDISRRDSRTQRAQSLGIFYQNIKPSLLKIDNQEGLQADKLAANIQAQYRLEGYFRGDVDLMTAIDTGLERAKKSQVYPAQLKNDGGFHSKSSFLTAAEWDLLLAFTQNKIAASVQAIESGRIPLAPYEDDRFIPSLTDPYRSVSLFDATDPINRYRKEDKKIDEKQFFNMLAAELEEDENDE
ncbi:PD-(D/E)XK nuclease family protein [Aerococcus kribbianus]|uniref:PD-(D/E)XK nuclease family protein n=1 Tax=Aerococcus kribbianus TaxID=2999064 RepID=A0A9X3JEM0_9LACT|nr:PD-(D/E)XK nuclease family protein [Aerococcus sp. YH-aer222]MCZ0725036.1 PD-(D/E)XK nuclease family protein [Aerococcus sp. YH-aer222]